jgi:hypothetical protein
MAARSLGEMVLTIGFLIAAFGAGFWVQALVEDRGSLRSLFPKRF